MTGLSPVSLLAISLDEIAGTSDERLGRFHREVDAFQTHFAAFFNDKTMRSERLSVVSLAQHPVFHFEEPAAIASPAFVLAAWALVTFGLAILRFHRALDLEPAQRRADPELKASVA